MKVKEIYSLTGLRFIAAFYVFLFHIHIRWNIAENHHYVMKFLSQGAIGMSLFFMLSGFVLAYRYSGKKISCKEYFVNRFSRIYPIYFLSALMTLPWLGIGVDNAHIRGPLLVIGNIFVIQAWIPQFFPLWNDEGSWSISVEVFLYLLFPLVLPLISGANNRTRCKIIFICYLFSAYIGFTAYYFKTDLIGIYYSLPIYRFPEFMIGACLSMIARDMKTNSGEEKYFNVRFLIVKYLPIIQLIVITLFAVYLCHFGDCLPVYIGHNWITIPVIGFFLFTLTKAKGFFSSILSSRLMVWLGKISYCFYSFQLVLLSLLITNYDHIVSVFPVLRNNKILLIVSLLVLTLMSGLGHHFIEEPCRKVIKRLFAKERNKDMTVSL